MEWIRKLGFAHNHVNYLLEEHARRDDHTGIKVGSFISKEDSTIHILDWKEQVLRNQTILLLKVKWRLHNLDETTWEREANILEKVLYIFVCMCS